MARQIPALATDFEKEVAKALQLVSNLEEASSKLTLEGISPSISVSELELSYELAFLRLFLAWEVFLEECLLRLMCGQELKGIGPEPLVTGRSYFGSIAAARTAILNGQPYKLWHNPAQVITRATTYLDGSNYERVIASASVQIDQCACIRHRIVHSQDDAKRRFDQVTMTVVGKRYQASRPGRFLRDWRPSPLNMKRWLVIQSEVLINLAHQIIP